MSRLDGLHRRSLEDPEGFWLEAAEAIDWTRKPARDALWAMPMPIAPTPMTPMSRSMGFFER